MSWEDFSIETWHRITCFCGANNWVCAGDLSNLTVGDIEGFKCWSCGQEHSFSEDEDPSFEEGKPDVN